MLKFFSRLERTRNFVLLLFAVVMVLSLILFYAPSRTDVGADLVRSTETAAKVGSEKITIGEVARLKQGQFGTLPARYLLNSLIGQRIIRVEAERLGLRATDAEVANEIRERNRPQEGAPFDQKRYEQFAIQQYGSVPAYEQTIRDQLSAEKLQAFITSGVTVSEEEVLNDYKRRNTKFDVTYVPVNMADVAQTINPTEEELRNYFEQNKANYYIGVPQKNVRYVFLNTAKIGENIPLSDEDLKAEYEKIPADKKIKGVEGQQIVLRIPKPEFEQQEMEKANELVERARKDGGKISEEGFAELVRGYSQDAASRQNDGKLPNLVRENPNNPTDPYQQLLTMEEGEVSDPINYQGRIFILRRGKTVPKTFEDARKELEVSLRNRRAYGVATELADKVAADLRQTKDVQATAQKFADEANMSVQEMVRDTGGFVKPGDEVPNIGVSPQFEDGIKDLNNPGDVGAKIPVRDGFAVPLLVEKREPRDATFEEVRDQVAENVKLEKARNQVDEIAKQIAASANSAGDLAAAAQARGLKAQEQKGYILGSPLGQGPNAGTSDALEDAVFGLNAGEVTKTPVKVGDNWYVVAVNNREEANMDEYAKQRDQFYQQMLTQKRGQVFSDYLAAARQRMEKDGEITIYQEAIERLDARPELPIEE